jgi:hypothetical protein
MLILRYTIGGVFYLYKIQFCNVYTQEVLREEKYDKPDRILSIIEDMQKQVDSKLGLYLFDSQMRTLKAEYISHKMIHEGMTTVYKIFFKVKLNDVQAKVRRV